MVSLANAQDDILNEGKKSDFEERVHFSYLCSDSMNMNNFRHGLEVSRKNSSGMKLLL